MRFALTSLLLLFLAGCTSSAPVEDAQACAALAAQAAEAGNRYVRSAGDTLDHYNPLFPGSPQPPMPEALGGLPERFEQADCSATQTADALRHHATDVRGNSIGAQAVRAGMLEGDAELHRLNQVIKQASAPP